MAANVSIFGYPAKGKGCPLTSNIYNKNRILYMFNLKPKKTCRTSNIAFVASTLPIQILDLMIEKWNITEVMVSNKNLLQSYKYLNLNNPKLKIVSLPSNTFLFILHLTLWLIKQKFKRRKIFFFHECCSIFFDILIGWFKLKGEYYPQVTLNSFMSIECSSIDSKNKIKKMLKILMLLDCFLPYLIDLDDNAGKSILWARVKYPKLINVHSLQASSEIKQKNNFESSIQQDGQLRVLMIIGRDVVADNELGLIYTKIIDELRELGFLIYIKDHPNPSFRLNLDCSNLIEIDPFLPAEMIKQEFHFVLGTASTGLAHFKDRSISILDMLRSSDSKILNRRKLHLSSLPNGNDIKFPSDIDQMMSIVKESLQNSRSCLPGESRPLNH